MTLSERIQELCGAVGTPGNEVEVRRRISSLLPDGCTRRVDTLGNLLVEKKGAKAPASPILFSAHMDEPGLIVENVDPLTAGVRFALSGNLDTHLLSGRKVWVLSGTERIPGVIGIKPIHVLRSTEPDEPMPAEDLFIDLGCMKKEDAEKLVHPGDAAAFAGAVTPFGHRMLRGRALDSRSACAVLLGLLEQDLPYDITAVFTVQRETGSAGMKTAAFQVQPGAAVVLESVPSADLASLGAKKDSPKLEEGPVLSLREQKSFYDRELFVRCQELAEQEKIPVQIRSAAFGTGNGLAAQTAGRGTRVLELGIPSRYSRTPCCVQSLKDLDALEKLLLPVVGMVGDILP